ncbi:MAG TPA: maleylpyruvate isomerase family mycothiol-dependent enzyme [Acidimicrobiales bacterium]|nr:maleylpyruvate isomerase family mycothiol-dependent enzyme [Acidimicrobiales bacterium]
MQISPRYDGPPILQVDTPIGDPSVPLVRQRRRLADVLATLDERQWAADTRCDGWTVQDVITHLITTNQFWTLSITSGLAGEPTKFLSTFDPVQDPAKIVDGMRDMTAADVLARYVETTDALADAVDGLDDRGWSTLAEAPPGHVAIRALVLHALWDAWIHERDVALPLGLEPVVEPDEVAGSLLYAAALGPAFYASTGSDRRGTLGVVASDPDVSFVVESGSVVVVGPGPAPVGAPCLTGDAVTLVEGLSFRGPLDHALADEDCWLLGGLAEVFDVVPESR